jgi:acetoin utilization protein AcuC
VAYLDVDAHHGDGVQEFFYRRSDVLTISLHESGRTLFPWGGFENEVGEGEGQGYNLNVPLPALTYDEAFLRAVDEVVMPVLAAVPRDALVLELGMDTLAGDPLTHMCLTNNAHVELVRRLVRLDKPVLVLGGGGYHVQNAVRGWARSWRAFLGEEEWEDFGLGLGGVMLESTEWAGGLRDRELPVTPARRASVEPELAATLQRVKQEVFRYHGLAPSSGSGEPPGAGQAARLKAGPL